VSPVTHLFASWLIAAKTTDNVRDRRLVTLSGILPDLDGAGIVADFARQVFQGGDDFYYYQLYHHSLLHGIFGAAVISTALACFAHKRWRVASLSFLLAHLHFLCDLIGSRGPSPADIWPISYLAPFSATWTFYWTHQWPLDAWPNKVISVALFVGCIWVSTRTGDSFVGVFNRRLDAIFVGVLRKWRYALFPIDPPPQTAKTGK
jgi:LexA-binding, inner membrane-associated putative hydrolase